jgi:DNA-binding SARP family transcriptional activator/tetratricopeptide (TPR) repeat protein
MDFLLLGPLEVRDNNHAITLGGPRQRAVLAMLLLEPNRRVAADYLLEELWGDPGAKNALEAAVSRLRRGPLRRRLETHPPGYVLRVDSGELDVERFERGLAEGREALAGRDAEGASRTLGHALDLFRGEPLTDFRYEPFAQAEIARIEELRLQALEERIEADLALGHHDVLIGELEPLGAAHPLRERLTAQLMLALYRSGRQAEALDVYRATRARLVEQLGLEPGPALRELEGAILRHDASLSTPSRIFPGRRTPGEGSREVRKLVSVLFTGLADAATLAERLDAEALRNVFARQFALAERAVTRHGGTVERHMGDTLLGIFGVPDLHEDDALRALRAASELRERVAALSDEVDRKVGTGLEVRIGVSTGEVIAGDPATGQEFVTGEPIVAAALLLERAGPGEMLIDETTRRLIGAAGRVEPIETTPGEAVTAWRVVGVDPEAPLFARRFDGPLVGRKTDLERLETVLRDTVRDRVPRLVTVVGVAGIGKSRLAQELVAEVGADVRILEGRCLPYGEGITFWPLRELVLQMMGQADVQRGLLEGLAGADDANWFAERVLGAVGLGETIAPVEEVLVAAKKLLESLAQRQTLVLIFEDVHWAEPAFLELIEHVVEFANDVPMLVLCLARPELLESRPDWGTRTSNSAVMEIGPLTDGQVERLLDSLGAAEHRTTIKLAAEGNPLFLEQIVAWLAEGSLLEGELPLPPTIRAILTSRLERLGPGERALLDCASIIGRDLWEDAVLELVPTEARPTVPRHLEALVSKQFLRPARTPVRGERAFRFRHVLIQAAAYRAVPKQVRARLHERFADWLEQFYRQRPSEVEEVVGYHLEQAARYQAEFGQPDASLAERAAERLASAGRRALWRGDHRAAASLLRRTADLTRPLRLDVHLELDLALVQRDIRDPALTLEAAAERAQTEGDETAAVLARAVAAQTRMHFAADFLVDEAEALARRSVALLEHAEDHAGLAHAWHALVFAAAFSGRFEEAAHAAEHAIHHARLAGQPPTRLFGLPAALIDGPRPADEALRTLEAALPENPQPQLFRAWLLAMLGRFEEAWAIARPAGDQQREFTGDLGGELELAEICMLEGDYEAAASYFRRLCDLVRARGNRGQLSTSAPLLGRSLCRLGRYDEAEAPTALGRELGTKQDVMTQVLWRQVQAIVDAHRGEHRVAEILAREAVAISERTDGLNLQGDALCDLAEVLAVAGRSDEAATALEKALDRYQRKQNLAMVAQARPRLDALRAKVPADA